MMLVKDKYGRIGRKSAFGSSIDVAEPGDHRGSVYISARSIEEDQAYYKAQEDKQRAESLSKRLQHIAQRNADKARQEKRAEAVENFQRLAKIDPMNERLKAYFTKRSMMGETDQVTEGLLPAPADFSQSGANPEYVWGERMTGGDQWRADFRQHMIVGNPLTRNGVFGPAVTDYERYVSGVDVNQTDIVDIAGGTMLGRYNGSVAPGGPNGMGSLSDFFSNLYSQTTDKLESSLSTTLSSAAQKELNNILGQGGQVTSTGGGVINVTKQVATGTTAGIPNWALFTGVGLLGVGVLFLVMKRR